MAEQIDYYKRYPRSWVDHLRRHEEVMASLAENPLTEEEKDLVALIAGDIVASIRKASADIEKCQGNVTGKWLDR